MKFKWNHTGVAGDGFEVNGRVKNGHFEGVKIWLEKTLSMVRLMNSDNYYISFSSTIIDYCKYIWGISKGLIHGAVEVDFGKVKSHYTLT